MREKVTSEGVLFTQPVGCIRLPSAVNDLVKMVTCVCVLLAQLEPNEK